MFVFDWRMFEVADRRKLNPKSERIELSATWDIRVVDATIAPSVCTKVDVVVETCPNEVVSQVLRTSMQCCSAFWVQISTFAALQDALMQE